MLVTPEMHSACLCDVALRQAFFPHTYQRLTWLRSWRYLFLGDNLPFFNVFVSSVALDSILQRHGESPNRRASDNTSPSGFEIDYCQPLHVLYEGTGSDRDFEPEIDIIAVHGLNPSGRNVREHAFNAWRKPSRDGGHIWLQDQNALPSIIPNARTMIYIYNSSVTIRPARERFVQEAAEFLEEVVNQRIMNPNRSLMLMGHSLGGLLIKEALVLAHANSSPRHRDILDSTFAIVFLGTPHAGPKNSMETKLGKMCAKLAKRSGFGAKDLMNVLEPAFLNNLEESWKHQLERYKFLSCYESCSSPVVPYESAILHLGGSRETVLRLSAGHSEICRFDLSNAEDKARFDLLAGNMARLCQERLEDDVTRSDNNLQAPPLPRRAALCPTTEMPGKSAVLVDYEVNPEIPQTAELSDIQKEILVGLDKHDENPRFDSIEKEYDETLRWIGKREHKGGPGFLEWLEDDSGMFWISGKPGAGKSTLMKYINSLPSPKNPLGGSPLRILSCDGTRPATSINYFFHELGVASESTFVGLLYSLLSQLLRKMPELIHFIEDRYDKLRWKGRWAETDLRGAFDDIREAPTSEGQVLCIVDGLDECEEKSITTSIQFLRRLSTPTGSGELRFRILCASRPETGIELALGRYLGFQIQDYTSGDIKDFVTKSIKEMTDDLFSGLPAIKICHELIPEIVSGAEGVFIWASTVVRELIIAVQNGEIDELQQRFDQLPSSLEDLYTRIFNKIPVALRRHTVNYLQLFLKSPKFILRPGPGNLLGMTLAINDGLKPPTLLQEDAGFACINAKLALQARCRGFITVPSLDAKWDHDELYTKFCMGTISVHKTAVDYFFATGRLNDLAATGFDPALLVDRYTQRARYLWRLLQFDTTTQKDARPDLREVEDKRISNALFNDLMITIKTSEEDPDSKALATTWLPRVQELVRRQDCTEENFFDSSTVHSYTFFERHAEDVILSPWHSDLISFAVFHRLFSFVDAIILDEKTAQKNGRPLLHYALSRTFVDRVRSVEMMSLLLSKGCRPEWTINFRCTWEYVLIDMYSRPSQFDTAEEDKVVLLFLEYGADPNQRVDLLLWEYGLYGSQRVGVHDYQCFALHVTLCMHTMPYELLEHVLRAFLERGADVNAVDSEGRTAIQVAESNWPKAIELLREYAGTGESSLRIAERSPSVGMVLEASEGEVVGEDLLKWIEFEEDCYGYKGRRRPLRLEECLEDESLIVGTRLGS